MSNEAQVELIKAGYTFDVPAATLGVLIDDGPLPDVPIRIPVGMFNRHGLVAGATGTGKTKTLQVMAEALSSAGVPVFAADIKGDLSGMASPGASNEKILARVAAQGQPWEPGGFPTEFYALGGIGNGVPVRATISAFGPVLLSKVLDLNQVQESSLGLVFHYADKAGLALLDLKDLIALLKFLTSDEGKAELKDIGGVSSATVGVILRSLVTLSDQGADVFFGEPEFDPSELMRTAYDGRGVVSLLELPELATRPALFSTFLMWLLADLYSSLPEVGDIDKPKLVFFFDEAHLLFRGASKAFLEAITQTVRLIRSKGVGVFFVTQTPKDVPEDVLAQLGSRVQHQLRAHTPNDAKALRATVDTYPNSGYDLEQVLQQLGTGEAIVTVMSEKGAPTPVARTRMWAPTSLMAPTPDAELQTMIAASPLLAKYGTAIDRESAYEMLTARLEEGARAAEAERLETERLKAEKEEAELRAKAEKEAAAEAERRRKEGEKVERELAEMEARQARELAKEEARLEREAKAAEAARKKWERENPSLVEQVTKSPVFKDLVRTAGREIIRGLFGTGRRR
ncbi:helicase HerA-like domain-containing protein [Tessaracoccus defluvii]|uniref:helicase HerA-like domain-containing protein n=1 Tax=Tessaracoccus defluvii TaxID=1285901 RepID=UPI001D051805|nr:helicase HerA-like domain-containing protein [Tessaracoccus defluvii]